MANTFFGLTIGKTGLYTYQVAINTTAHNASNIATEGYTRQETIRQAADPLSLSSKYGMVGAGVNVKSIESIRDAYYDTKYRYNNAILADQNTKSYYLDAIQSYFSEVNSDGTSDAMDNFFATLSGLSGDVGNTTIRTETTSQGTTFAESINYLYDSLQRTQIEINQEIKTISEQINAYAEEIATITRQINTIEVRGENANDLRDKRELLVDKLSEYANVTAVETFPENSSNQYIVKMDGALLVDTYEYYTLEVTASKDKVNEGDADGLYGLMWSSGQAFGSKSTTLGGKLQSLFELRDGNNNKNFNGQIDLDSMTDGGTTIKVKGANIQSIAELNIPSEDGVISVGSHEYKYDSFTISYNETSKEYEYTFNLKEPLGSGDKTAAENYADLNNGINFQIGSKVAYKGIPYYMAQINEFARTFAKDFNDIHRQGKDFYGNCDELDFFTGTHAGNGLELELEDDKGTDVDPLTTYYALNAGNLKVAKVLVDDCKKIACGAGDPYKLDENGDIVKDANGNPVRIPTDSGIEDNTILKQLADLCNDVTMFKQGTPSDFFESFIAVMGVAGQEAEAFTDRQEAIMASVEQQRMSVSGVDQDEEAMDMVKFKGAYDLCSKVISTMNEIYNKLINETGV